MDLLRLSEIILQTDRTNLTAADTSMILFSLRPQSDFTSFCLFVMFRHKDSTQALEKK